MISVKRSGAPISVLVLIAEAFAAPSPEAVRQGQAVHGRRTSWQESAAQDPKGQWSGAVTLGKLDMRQAREKAWAALPFDFDPPDSWPAQRRCFSTPASEANGTRYCLPAILGICCMGAGTSSLSMYLNHHPHLTYGATKEHRFAGIGIGFRKDTSDVVERQDAARYAAEFPLPSDMLAEGFDFSPMYILRDGQRKARIARAFLGEHVRFLLLFRDPAEAMCKFMRRSEGGWRAATARVKGFTQIKVQRLWEECVFQPHSEQEVKAVPPDVDYIHATPMQRCLLAIPRFCLPDLLQPWLEEFPLRQFWLMKTQDLAEHTRDLLHNVSRFLQVPLYQYPAEVVESRMHVQGASKGDPRVDTAARDAAIARAKASELMIDRCKAAQSAPGSYMSSCSARLEQLLKQRRLLPLPALDDVQHADLMAHLER